MQDKQILNYRELARSIYCRYIDFYGSDLLQGASLLIADELKVHHNLRIVSGVLTVDGQQNAHYWNILQNIPIDPLFDDLRRQGVNVTREVTEFNGEAEAERNLKRYIQYKL